MATDRSFHTAVHVVDPQVKHDLFSHPDHAHIVHFYDHDNTLFEAVTAFLMAGLREGEPLVVIATKEHREGMWSMLAMNGYAPAALAAAGRLTLLDAADVLATFMRDGMPDPERFETSVGAIITRVHAAHAGMAVRAYGEMVDLLWRAGNSRAALALEQLWNDLAKQRRFSLFCAYVMGSFYKAGGADGMDAICAAHSHVLPDVGTDVDLLRQQARALRREVDERRKLESALRAAIDERMAAQQHVESLYRVGRSLHAELDLDKVEQRLAEEASPLCRAEVGEFVRPDALARVMTENDRALRVVDAAVGGEVAIGLATLLADHGAMRSLLCVPVVARSGEVLGGLVFGHAQPDAFTQADEDAIVAIARSAGTAIENARLHRGAQAARAEAEHANRVKDEFLAMLGHELRNPLSPIVTAVQLLKLRSDGGPSRELDIIDRQVQHLVHLVDDLLDISRITRNKIELVSVPIKLAVVLSRAIEVARPLLDDRGHALELVLPDGDVWLLADEVRLCQVFSNLLSNAAKYTPAGGRVCARVERSGDEVVVRISDNGAGIAPELLPRVFEPFVQGARGSDRQAGGLGIGLTVVRNLVQLHGGSVAASSAGPGTGTEVTVRLPTVQDEARAEPRRITEAMAATSAALQILVVDDNVDAAILVADLLRSLGHEVRVAHDAHTALQLSAERVPDVALLDIGLPVVDGYELAAELRGRIGGGAAGLRLVAITGYGQPRDRARARAAGFDAHVVKPVTLAKLVQELSPALARLS